MAGLSEAQVRLLVSAFEQARRQRYESEIHFQRQGAGGKGKLPMARQKVDFCLYYLKHYPSYDVLAYTDGFARSSAYEALHRYRPLVLPGFGATWDAARRAV